jgi:hypothetical protein
MPPTFTVLCLTGLLAVGPSFADASGAGRQPGTPAAPGQTQSVTLPELFAQIGRAEPIRRAGLRADLLRRAQQVAPTVVIVSDARSYLAAIAGWEGPRRFPVLWDDGSIGSRENIARFVRAFAPETVLRFEAGDETPAWPRARADREAMALSVLAKASDERMPDFDSFLRDLRAAGVAAPGIVLTDVDDTAWPAAVALAAGRSQPIGFIENPSTLNPPLTPAQADLLEEAAQRVATTTGMAWQGIGDDIDAVTLCLNTGTRIKTGEGARDILSTTDRVGRTGENGTGRRWAHTGQIFGSSPQAVYRAMCSLFLTPSDAFIFDGYDDTQPWVQYSGPEAADVLRAMNIEPQLHFRPRNTTGHWLALGARPIRAGLIFINSHGGQTVLNFPGGQVRGTDTPLLDRPAIAHIVHSFSLQNAPNRATVGGALLDRGVYALLGSTDEPFLQAFMPTPMVARRLGAGMNLGAAVRIDDAPVWKLTLLGDPLITLGPPGTRVEGAEPSLAGQTTDLDAELKSALGDRDLGRAAGILTLLGRDRDAARLASAAIADEKTSITPDLAAASIPALFREGQHEQVLAAYANLTDELRADPVLADCFWFSARFLLGSSRDLQRVESLMRVFQRPSSRVADAEEIAMHLRRRSVEEAVLVLESLRPKITQDWEFRLLEAALQRVRGTP